MREPRGFTLIELLVVVAIVGIVSSLALAALTNSLDKGKQKRTMADMHSMAEAVESYNIDHASYPRGVSDWTTMRTYVSPFFIKAPPDADGWAHGWVVSTDAAGDSYSLVSLGKDGVQGPWNGGMTGNFNCDIILSNGQFFQWPQGTQQ